MYRLLERLDLEHRRLARLLNLLDKLLDLFHEGEEPDYELMCEMLEYMESYSDQVHHPTEDLIFQRVQELGGEQRPVLDVLMHQHRRLVELNRRFRHSLEGVVHEEVLRRDEVESQGRELVDTLRRHMELEDSEAFPFVLQHLSADDWEQLAEAAPDVNDPVFGNPDPARFRSLYQHLMAQVHP
jgi:hemerythrin-like domain-containing protein